ncbi:hypothetical protein V5O48_011058 [Marasmius crinis-equi]|uniref:Uncharacterized protein n=1 Tax=Marasmius crinis-equi TaxID=585013 RepID=A0ABR3F726_9AGAR
MPKVVCQPKSHTDTDLIQSWRKASVSDILLNVESLVDLHENLEELCLQLASPIQAMAEGKTDSALRMDKKMFNTVRKLREGGQEDADAALSDSDDVSVTAVAASASENRRLATLKRRLRSSHIKDFRDLMSSINALIASARRRALRAEKRYAALHEIGHLDTQRDYQTSLQEEVRRLIGIIKNHTCERGKHEATGWMGDTEDEEEVDVQEAVLTGRV